MTKKLTLYHGHPVSAEPFEPESSTLVLTAIGRENISQKYEGGLGYVGVPFAVVDAGSVELVDLEGCDALQNYIDAMSDVDDLADDYSPATAAALMIEDIARQNLISHINSLATASAAARFTPNIPGNSPAFHRQMENINAEELSGAAVALHS